MENLTLYSIIIAVTISLIFFIGFELSHPKPEIILPMVILSVVAIIGRLIFAFIPQVQPATVLIIIAGYYLGSGYGYVCGSLVAIVSNITLGQGPWTPFQMLGWGIVGFLGGFLPKFKNIGTGTCILSIYSIFAGFLYSIIVDIITVTYLGSSFTIQGATAVFAAGLAFNIPHAIGNLIFTIILVPLLNGKLVRIMDKYAHLS